MPPSAHLRQPDTRSAPLSSSTSSLAPPGPSALRLALRMAPAAAGIVAVAALASGLAEEARDPAAAAETAYLAFAAGIVLLGAAAVARRVTVPVLGAVAVAALAWILPVGPVRGALVGIAGAATLALAVAERVGRPRGDAGPTRAIGLEALLRPLPAVGLALGLQALLRADELLGPPSALWGLVVYLALPVVGTGAVLILARLEGPAVAALAAAAVLVIGPGFRPATVVALVALVAAQVLCGRGGEERRGRADRLPLRLGALALLTAPVLWSPPAALVSALAGLTLTLRGRAAVPFAVALTGVGMALAAAFTAGGRPPAAALLVAMAVPAAVPTLVLPPRGRIGIALAALALTAAAAMAVPVDGALAAPAALAAGMAGMTGTGSDRLSRRVVPALQGTWSVLLLGGAALAGSYPWLRGEPLSAAFQLFGLPDAGGVWTAGAAAVVLALLLAGLARSVAAWTGKAVPPVTILLTLLVAASGLATAAPRSRALLIARDAPLSLSAPRAAWSTRLDPGAEGRAIDAVVIDSSLANAAPLEPGTPVATVALRGVGEPEMRWTLRVGRETGEWAADREAGPAARAPDPSRPAPWVSWVPAPEEGGAFYGHSYRAILPAEAAPGGKPGGDDTVRGDRLEIRLRPDLPPGVILTVFRLELR